MFDTFRLFSYHIVMLFDLGHILYMIISLAITVALLVVFAVKIKTQSKKDLVLKIFAIVTVILHYSSLWVDFFSTGTAEVESPMLLPIYPCNICMWLLVAVAFVKKRQGIAYKMLAEFTFYAGVVCGFIGILLNEAYASTPNLLDWDTLKGLLSHSTMIVGCAYILVGRYIKISVSNVLSVICGLILFLIDGGIIIGLYKLFGLDPVNSMYLLENPLPELPWLNTFILGVFAIVLVFLATAIYEQFAFKKEERWYTKIKEHFSKNKKIEGEE